MYYNFVTKISSTLGALFYQHFVCLNSLLQHILWDAHIDEPLAAISTF